MRRIIRYSDPFKSNQISRPIPRRTHTQRNGLVAWILTLVSLFVYLFISDWTGRTQVVAHQAGHSGIVLWLDVVEISATLSFALSIFVIEYIFLLRPWRWAAQHDALTSLLNQGAFWKIAQELWERYHKKAAIAILISDVDHFKSINDQAGHLQGDQVLMHIGHALGQPGSSTAIVGRIGGEEFAALWVGVPAIDIYRTAEHWAKLVQGIECPQGISDITISIGIAMSRPSSIESMESLKSLARQADEALYRAKSNGRNRIETTQC